MEILRQWGTYLSLSLSLSLSPCLLCKGPLTSLVVTRCVYCAIEAELYTQLARAIGPMLTVCDNEQWELGSG